jgi:hypothetical protein
MNAALEQHWFDAAQRDSLAAEELEALEERARPDFTRVKLALAVLAAAFVMLLFPVFGAPAPRPGPKVPSIAVARAPAVASKPSKPPQPAAKPAKKAQRPPGKLVARSGVQPGG